MRGRTRAGREDPDEPGDREPGDRGGDHERPRARSRRRRAHGLRQLDGARGRGRSHLATEVTLGGIAKPQRDVSELDQRVVIEERAGLDPHAVDLGAVLGVEVADGHAVPTTMDLRVRARQIRPAADGLPDINITINGVSGRDVE